MSLYGFGWIIPGRLAAMAGPDGSPDDFEELKALGIGALVNLTRSDWPPQLIAASGLRYLHLPIGDLEPPGQGQVDEFVTFCDESMRQGRAVAVHCLAGKGRTGTMAACYLVHRGAAAQEAIGRVRRLRARLR